MRSFILLAHGARDPEWAGPLLRLCETVARREAEADVRVAFLEFMTPDLAGAVDEAVAAGASNIDVVPVFLAQGGHVKRDLPRMVDEARARHPQVRIELRDAVGEAPHVIEAIADVVLGN